jgi:FtsZ-interacting cell division protein ZipA
MSELQLGLLAVGALAVVAVVIYNKWQERRLASSTDRAFRSQHDDVLLKSSRRGADRSFEAAPQRIEPVLHAAEDYEPADAPDADESIDYIVHIRTEQPVSGEFAAAGAELGAIPRARLEGYSEARMVWDALDTGAGYTRLCAVLQLVSRQGVTQDDDLAAFAAAAEDLAHRVGGVAQADDPDAALARANELDAFCSDVDLQIALHVVPQGDKRFAGARVRALAEASGMHLGGDGRFHKTDESDALLFSLDGPRPFDEQTIDGIELPGLTLLLDVPRAPGGIATFHACAALAKYLAGALDAVVADDNRNALDARAFNAIAAQLAVVYQTMEARGIAAGSPLALRLFS